MSADCASRSETPASKQVEMKAYPGRVQLDDLGQPGLAADFEYRSDWLSAGLGGSRQMPRRLGRHTVRQRGRSEHTGMTAS
jgi:hypothetical protein